MNPDFELRDMERVINNKCKVVSPYPLGKDLGWGF